MKIKYKKHIAPFVYHIVITLIGFVMVYPVLWMISGSFRNNTEILNGTMGLIPPHWRFDNYTTGWRGFGGISFATFFKNSFIVTGIATAATVMSSACISYSFARLRYPGRKLLFSLMIMSLLLPGQVLLIPQYLIYNKMGLVPSIIPLVLPHFLGQAFFIFQMMQFMAGIPRELDEAAFVDGCSRYGIFRRIVVPLLKPAVITTIIIQFYWKWDDFQGPLIYLSKPQSYTMSIALKLFADSSSRTDYGAMFAMSTLSLLPVFLIFLFFNKYLTEGISTSGLKG